MNIFIAGGGRVGFHLARLLSKERQDVTVIESNADRVEEVDYALDVSTVLGDGSSSLKLQALGVGSAELFVASMGDDETNLIAAALAKGLGAKQVVARVDNPKYIKDPILYEEVLGLDYILSPDALCALEIADYCEHPGIIASEDFGRGRVHMREVRVAHTPTVNGKTLKDVLTPRSGVLLGVINRDGESFIPHGDAKISVGDQVTLIGQADRLQEVQRLFQAETFQPSRVAIMGGSRLGRHLADALERRVRTVKLFERRMKSCHDLAEELPHAKIVCRDGTSRVALEQEHINEYDLFVAATNDDERNIMASVLAKQVGARMVVAIVHQPDFAPLAARLGIDYAVTPRTSIANRILKLVHQPMVTSLAVLGEGQVEVVELTVSSTSPLAGKMLKDCASKLPRGALIATILRGDDVVVPGGDDRINAGDGLVLIAATESLATARRLLTK